MRSSKVPSPRPPPSPRQPALAARSKVKYTCYIRLPFARGDFLDPPQVEWDAGKDKALWKVVSKTSNSKVCIFLFAHHIDPLAGDYDFAGMEIFVYEADTYDRT